MRDGAVVAAGSASADVPPRALAGGNPARIIRQNVTWVE